MGAAVELTLSRIAEAHSLPVLWRAMTRFFARHGFGATSYYLMRQGSSQVATLPIQHGYERSAVDAYISSDFQRLDIVPRIAIANGEPVLWSEIWTHSETTPEEREFHAAMVVAGFQDGIALPVYGPNLRNACIGISHMSGKVDLSQSSLALLQFVAQAAHLRTCAMFSDELTADRQLSSREKEILDWVARGKSNSVIAEILEISPGTVDTYMRRIYVKLDVSDRTSAAVKGVGMGLIAA